MQWCAWYCLTLWWKSEANINLWLFYVNQKLIYRLDCWSGWTHSGMNEPTTFPQMWVSSVMSMIGY